LQELASLIVDRKIDPFTAAEEIKTNINTKTNNGCGS
jgi:hypothetical protein